MSRSHYCYAYFLFIESYKLHEKRRTLWSYHGPSYFIDYSKAKESTQPLHIASYFHTRSHNATHKRRALLSHCKAEVPKKCSRILTISEEIDRLKHTKAPHFFLYFWNGKTIAVCVA